jgi:cation:H+ antiporter
LWLNLYYPAFGAYLRAKLRSMSLLLWIGVFVISLVVLITAARYFTRSAEIIGLTLGMSSFATGVIIVALGTSLPELISALIAVRKGASEIVAGNIIGSSISNLFLVMSLTTIFSPKPVKLGDQYIFIDLHFLVGAAFLLAIMMWDGVITLIEGLLLLAAYVTYVFYLLNEGDTSRNMVTDQKVEQVRHREKVRVKDLGIIILSAIFIFVGANYTITSLEIIAESFGISKAIISVTLLSLGTTLPEAVVSVSAAREGKADIAVGNVLGSCVFNALGVPGLAVLIGNIAIPPEIAALPLPVYLIGVVLFYLITQDKRISKWEGILFLLFYILFILKVTALA